MHGDQNIVQAGVYIKFEIHIFAPPPPFLIYIFPQMKFNMMSGWAGGKISAFFSAIFSQLGKRYAYFLPIGEKICIFLPFFIPFQ